MEAVVPEVAAAGPVVAVEEAVVGAVGGDKSWVKMFNINKLQIPWRRKRCLQIY